ncbi:MAG: hypothetical protein AB7U43_13090 [Desulfobacter sp.]
MKKKEVGFASFRNKPDKLKMDFGSQNRNKRHRQEKGFVDRTHRQKFDDQNQGPLSFHPLCLAFNVATQPGKLIHFNRSLGPKLSLEIGSHFFIFNTEIITVFNVFGHFTV